MALDTIVSVVGMLGEATVSILLLRRKSWRTLPFFSIYVAWSLLTDIVGTYLLIYKIPDAYNRFYLIYTPVDACLQFTVLVELARSVLSPVRKILPRGTTIILGLLVALAGLAIWPLAGTTVPQDISSNARFYVHFQETIAILRVVCFLVLAGFSQVLSIGWRDRELQIATGLGFFSIVSLMVAVLHSHQVEIGAQYLRLYQAVTFSYLGTLFYWVVSFSTKEQERKEFSPQMQNFLLQMGGGARAGRIALTDLPAERSKQKDK
ncbi:hypothetical protein [Acidicapsa ligni]|uniref:hypothetical protein n=1 Tax=Acidicapsa ligni TaxID=542300 RepID=UPI0021E01E62|nr:hypothetical protein [Acidicapsa ligni]